MEKQTLAQNMSSGLRYLIPLAILLAVLAFYEVAYGYEYVYYYFPHAATTGSTIGDSSTWVGTVRDIWLNSSYSSLGKPLYYLPNAHIASISYGVTCTTLNASAEIGTVGYGVHTRSSNMVLTPVASGSVALNYPASMQTWYNVGVDVASNSFVSVYYKHPVYATNPQGCYQNAIMKIRYGLAEPTASVSLPDNVILDEDMEALSDVVKNIGMTAMVALFLYGLGMAHHILTHK